MEKGKLRALLGVLIVFIIPVIVVSTVYLSKKPETYSLPIVKESVIADNLLIDTNKGVFNFAEYNEDLFLVFSLTNSDDSDFYTAFSKYYQETLTYPEKTFKDPYPQIIFLNTSKSQMNNQFDTRFFEVTSTDLNSISSNNQINLVDNLGNLRAQYEFNSVSILQLKKDMQNLMAETFHKNNKSGRRDTF